MSVNMGDRLDRLSTRLDRLDRSELAAALTDSRYDVEVMRAGQLAAVVRTLRWTATVLFEEGETSDELQDWIAHWREVADLLESQGDRALEGCCPLCQEVSCDEDCPLEEVRS